MAKLKRSLSIIFIILGLCLFTILINVIRDSDSYWILFVVLLLWPLSVLLHKWWQRRQAGQRMPLAFERLHQEILAGNHQGHYGLPGHVTAWEFAGRAKVALPTAVRFLDEQARHFSAPRFIAAQGEDWPTYDFSGLGQPQNKVASKVRYSRPPDRVYTPPA